MKLTDFKVLTFDCYGTLIDWETGMVTGLVSLTDRFDRELTRNEILEAHALYESSQQRQTPTKRYQELLATVYRRLAEAWGLSVSWEECLRYGRSIKDWPAFPDSAEALRYLKQYYRLVILSNVDNESFAASNSKLGVEFDAIYTTEDIGSYKPADANFDYMLTMLQHRGIGKAEILHTAESLFHDHAPANCHGLKSCWIYRRHGRKVSGRRYRWMKYPDTIFVSPAWLNWSRHIRQRSRVELFEAATKQSGRRSASYPPIPPTRLCHSPSSADNPAQHVWRDKLRRNYASSIL